MAVSNLQLKEKRLVGNVFMQKQVKPAKLEERLKEQVIPSLKTLKVGFIDLTPNAISGITLIGKVSRDDFKNVTFSLVEKLC